MVRCRTGWLHRGVSCEQRLPERAFVYVATNSSSMNPLRHETDAANGNLAQRLPGIARVIRSIRRLSPTGPGSAIGRGCRPFARPHAALQMRVVPVGFDYLQQITNLRFVVEFRDQRRIGSMHDDAILKSDRGNQMVV